MDKDNIFLYIDNLVEKRKKRIIIWGAGESTKMLCELTDILTATDLEIIDQKKSGETFYGYMLKDADEINFCEDDVVIVSSMNGQEEIVDLLKNKYSFYGEIITLYQGENPMFLLWRTDFFLYMQKRYEKRVEQLCKKDVIRIGYIVTQNELWNLDSFYREVSKEDRLYFEVVALPNPENILESPEVSCEVNYKFFESRGINVIHGYDSQAGKLRPIDEWDYDILFWDQPGAWGNIIGEIPFYLFLKKFLLCYVPYGFKVADGKGSHFNLRYHNLSWKIFAESEWHCEQFRRMGEVKGQNVVTTGFPKLDTYLADERDYSVWKNGESGKKKIIWAPHWTFRNPGWQYSTFDRNYKEFFEYAKTHPETDWIVKPHQRLYFWCVESGLMTEEEMRNYFEEWNGLDNAVVCDGGNYMNLFVTSDALITDCGSFLAEYLPSKKPVIHLYNSGCMYNEIGEKIIDSYYRCAEWSDIQDTIERVILKDDDYKKQDRFSVMKYVTPNRNGAGKTVLQELKKSFKLE